jgi:hypothetical protein
VLVVVPAGHRPHQYGWKFLTEPVFEVAVLPVEERLFERDDEQPGPERGSSAGTLG